MKKSDSIVEIAKALSEFRKEVKQPMKDANNPFFKSKYVPLPNVVEAIDETAPKHGLSFVQWLSNDESGQIGVSTMIIHNSGEFLEFDPVFMKAEKQTPQGAGSLATYLKRYTLSAAFGITSDEDDDGNQATGNNQSKQQYNKQQYNQPKQSKMHEDNKQLPMQDKEKLELTKQKATDLADIINSQDGADPKNPTTQQQILGAYLKKLNATDITKVSNENLVYMLKAIEGKINNYKAK